MKEQHELWQRAVSFAARAHRGQVRKDGETPYAAHPFRVMMTVRAVFGVEDAEILAAAALHDTIEDTTTDYDDLLKEFGAEVAGMVTVLTKDMRLPEAERERVYFEGLHRASWKARLVKMADSFDNLCDSAWLKGTTKALDKARKAADLLKSDDPPPVKRAAEALGKLLAERGG